MAGYSGTPLVQKLGIKSGMQCHVADAPPDYAQWVAPLPEGAKILPRLSGKIEFVHVFALRKTALATALASYRKALGPAGVVWVSWPKKSAKVATDITEDTIRELALPLGFVDVKVCAVSDVWSGLKLVVRKALR